jgi:hypothetical protein
MVEARLRRRKTRAPTVRTTNETLIATTAQNKPPTTAFAGSDGEKTADSPTIAPIPPTETPVASAAIRLTEKESFRETDTSASARIPTAPTSARRGINGPTPL